MKTVMFTLAILFAPTLALAGTLAATCCPSACCESGCPLCP